MKKLFAIVMSCLLALGVLFGCGGQTPSGKVEELEGLRGRVVYSIGQGNVPDLVFRYLLNKAGVEYRFSDEAKEGVVSLAYVGEGTELIGGLKAGKMNYGVISEPAATVAVNNVEGASRMLDIQQLYNKVSGSEHGYPQAALVVKKSLLDSHPGYVAAFLQAFKSGAKWAETNPADALAAIKAAGSTAVPLLNETVAKGCNLGFTSAKSAKSELLAFYEGLNAVKAEGETPVGDKMPDDAFFADADALTADAEDAAQIKVYAPDGAPAISLAKMIADGFEGAQFNIVLPANIGGAVAKGDADIAVMPTNAAAMLYGKGTDIVMLGVTNFGSLYMVGKV